MHSLHKVATKRFLFSLLLLVLSCRCKAMNFRTNISLDFWTDDELSIAKAIGRLLEKSYLHMTNTVDILMANDNKYERYYQQQFLDEVLKEFPLLTVRLDYTLCMRLNEPRYYLLIMADKPESFRKALESRDPNPYDFAGYLIIFFTDFLGRWEINRIFRVCLDYNVINVVLVLPRRNTLINLYTYYPFLPGLCYNSEKIEFCSYARERFINRWGQQECIIFPKKLRNLYGCPVYANIWEIPPEIIYTRPIFSRGRLEGFEGEMLRTLEKIFNFNLVVKYLDVYRRGKSFDLRLTTHNANFSVGRNYYPSHLQDTVSPSTPYFTSRLLLIAHVGQPFNFVELILLILERGLWLVLVIIIVIPYFVIWLLHRTKRSLREKILGEKNTTPYYNVLVTIFGGPVYFKSSSYIAGYIFICWLWLTIVFRQGYQSMLYNFMRSEPRIERPETIDALLRKGGLIGASPLLHDIVEQVPQFKPGIVVQYNVSELIALEWLENHSSRSGAIITPMESFRYYQQTLGYRRKLYALREPLFDMKICIQFRKRSFLKSRFDHMLMAMMSSGLINYWETVYTSKFVSYKNVSRTYEIEPNYSLFMQLEEFKGLVMIYFLMIGVAFVVLIYEIAYARIHQRQQRRCRLRTKDDQRMFSFLKQKMARELKLKRKNRRYRKHMH